MGATSDLVQGAFDVIAKAHHGSVSKDRRRQVEQELKSGQLPCVVATSSLELGIDMGAVDLVLQVAPPPSVASGLQRIGRANHQVGGRSEGIVYPRTRNEVIDAAVVSEGMRAGAIEQTTLVRNALDVLAQQTVAAVAMDDWAVDDWFDTVRRAAPYADLPRRAFQAVLDMLAGRHASADLSDFKPRIVWDREAGRLSARPGAQRLAVVAAGTIPDRGMFSVVLPEGDAAVGRRRVGELDEEMVYESRVGDIIALGTSTWRIREITRDRVIVEPAPGRSARLPFWHGEGVGRPAETGRARGAFVRAVAAGIADDVADGERWQVDAALCERLAADGLDDDAQRNLVALVREQRAATGAVPDDRTLVVERCEDETGDWRVMLHSPYGRRVHEPWAMAVADRVMRLHGFDPQASSADDGIVLRIPQTETRLPGAELFVFDPDELDRIVRDRVDATSLFAARFRECAARALLMSPTTPGKRAPLWQQRLKAGQLLEAARREQEFPILLETARECLQDVYDLPALHTSSWKGCRRAASGWWRPRRPSRRRSLRRCCSATWATTCTTATCPMPNVARRCSRWTRRCWASFWARRTWPSSLTRTWCARSRRSCSMLRPTVGCAASKGWPTCCAPWARCPWKRLPRACRPTRGRGKKAFRKRVRRWALLQKAAKGRRRMPTRKTPARRRGLQACRRRKRR